MNEAKAAGAAIVKPAQDTFWGGYSGYFRDPDDHLREVAWNPRMLHKTDDSEYGKFGWVADPDGNKVELWQPPAGQ